MSTRTALFWKCQARPDALLKHVLLRLQHDGLRLPEGPNLQQKMLDRESGNFISGKSVEIVQWRDGAEFAEHWDGLSFRVDSLNALTVEILTSPDGGVLMLHEDERAYERQRSSAHEATRWAGLLLAVWAAASPEECLFPLDLAELPWTQWAQAVSLRRPNAELRITREPGSGTPPPGFNLFTLAAGGTMLTSLPVKRAPA